MVLRNTLFTMLAFAAFAPTTVSHAATPYDACGKDEVHFKVHTDKKQHLSSTPEAGKAQIVFIETLEGSFMTPPTARFGIDGTWVGANRGASYFAVSATAGEHHLCARRQSSIKDENDNAGAMTLQLQSGSVYYVEFQIQRNEIGDASTQGTAIPSQTPGSSMMAKEHPTIDTVTFKTLTAVEGQARVSKLPMSTSSPK
jgi:hypothetical protein